MSWDNFFFKIGQKLPNLGKASYDKGISLFFISPVPIAELRVNCLVYFEM